MNDSTLIPTPFHSGSCICPAYQHHNQARNSQLEEPKQEQQCDLTHHLSWCRRQKAKSLASKLSAMLSKG
eukprot:497495-Pelagomonas_calceolata.AAC.1